MHSPIGFAMGGVQRLSARRALGYSMSVKICKIFFAHLLQIFSAMHSLSHRVCDGGNAAAKCSTRAWRLEIVQTYKIGLTHLLGMFWERKPSTVDCDGEAQRPSAHS